MAIIAVLEYNQWFTKLSTKDYKLVQFCFYLYFKAKLVDFSNSFYLVLDFPAVSCYLKSAAFQSTDVCDQILRVVARSSRLEELMLDGAGLRRSENMRVKIRLMWHFFVKKQFPTFDLCLRFLFHFSDFAQKLASALAQNPSSALHTFNLSNNSLEDKGGNMFTRAHMRYIHVHVAGI